MVSGGIDSPPWTGGCMEFLWSALSKEKLYQFPAQGAFGMGYPIIRGSKGGPLLPLRRPINDPCGSFCDVTSHYNNNKQIEIGMWECSFYLWLVFRHYYMWFIGSTPKMGRRLAMLGHYFVIILLSFFNRSIHHHHISNPCIRKLGHSKTKLASQ